MRLTLLVNYDLASALALQLLTPALAAHDVTVYYSQKPNPNVKRSQKLLSLSQFEQSLIEKMTDIWSAVHAEKLNHINTKDRHRFIDSAPELVISIRHMSILQKPIIDVPKYGVINLHSGQLPEYQGVMATFWAMLNEEAQIGTTLHRIEDSSIDTGAIIAQRNTPTNFRRSYLANVLSLYPAGCESVLAAIAALQNNGIIESADQTGPSKYYGYPDCSTLMAFPYPLFLENDFDVLQSLMTTPI